MSCFAKRYVSRNTTNVPGELHFLSWWSPAQKPRCSWESPWRPGQRMRAMAWAVKEHTEKREMMIHGIVSPEVAAFPEQMCHCPFAELWPLVPAWFCRDEEVCSAQQLSKGLLGMPRYSYCLFFLTFRGLCWSLHYLPKQPCANIPALHLNFPIFTLH